MKEFLVEEWCQIDHTSVWNSIGGMWHHSSKISKFLPFVDGDVKRCLRHWSRISLKCSIGLRSGDWDTHPPFKPHILIWDPSLKLSCELSLWRHFMLVFPLFWQLPVASLLCILSVAGYCSCQTHKFCSAFFLTCRLHGHKLTFKRFALWTYIA